MKQLRFTIPNTEFEKISEMLETFGALSVSVTDAKNQPIYEIELHQYPLWDQSEISAIFDDEVDLSTLIRNLNFTNYKLEKVENKNWERVCMDQFHPMQFGQKLWICPSWEEVSIPDAVILKLDPGLAFGTGSHPTTKLCLEWIATHEITHKTVIDFGCGSGILAIACAKLGAEKVYAIDIDPQALEATLENAEKNNVSLITAMPDQLPLSQADIIIANILANPLISLAPILLSHLKTNGQLILSGLLENQIEPVKAAYESFVQFDSPIIEEEWVRLEGKKIMDVLPSLALDPSHPRMVGNCHNTIVF